MQVGILALQGAFLEHGQMLQKLGADSFEIRKQEDIDRPFDGLILPGGESTVIGKLLQDLKLYDLLREHIQRGMPVLGTCAGLILLAKEVANNAPPGFATMDIAARRNAYGRQLGSFHAQAEMKGIGTVPMTFIRAPIIERVWNDAEVLAEVDGNIVAARQGNQLVTAFHPELDDDRSIHRFFLELVEQNQQR